VVSGRSAICAYRSRVIFALPMPSHVCAAVRGNRHQTAHLQQAPEAEPGQFAWTATPTGVIQWRTPAGALNRFTWAPISVRAGAGTYAIGVFEVTYWYTHMRYVWEYTSSLMSNGAKTSYCSYS